MHSTQPLSKVATVANTTIPDGATITFLRKREYLFVRELGHGACGKTILLLDQDIQEHIVCKKFDPYSDKERLTLYQNFVREIKLLYQLHHANVVRCFHHYLFPESAKGYILMEYVDGKDIGEHTKASPERIDDLFLQAIDGFAYLETKGIMHRDIRPSNILVTDDGRLKIIDLGFGKRVVKAEDFQKSITLNWHGERPAEFEEGRYDFTTEVYFVGKLFERLIQDNWIEHFSYKDILREMCAHSDRQRTRTFAEIQQRLRSGQFHNSGFSEEDAEIYRRFATTLTAHITKIDRAAKYAVDIDRVITQLTDTQRRCVLEESIPDAATVIRCLLVGGYYYRKAGFPTTTLTDFLGLLKRTSNELRNVIVANLHTRLDAIARYDKISEDDVPF